MTENNLLKKKRIVLIAAGVAAALLIALVIFFTRPPAGDEIPSVFIHGYSGWGQYDERYEDIPYWGLTLTDFRSMFGRWDQDIYMPSVGPYSSAWDRACEIYAEITGTRVDYGEAHSKACGHERFGHDYSDDPLIPDFAWDEKHPVNLVGHSFGGNTARVLLDLLADGAPEETAATGAETSPLFTGGHEGMVFSLSIIASPSNGATVLNALAESGGSGNRFSNSDSYDVHLEHFGIESGSGTTREDAETAMTASGFYDHYDSAVNDMNVDRACAMNAEIEMQPGVYYFCYYGCRTHAEDSGNSVPSENMCRFLKEQASLIGAYRGKTAGSVTTGYKDGQKTIEVPSQDLDEEWQPNDGTVNVVSAYCPFHLDSSGNRVYDPHVEYSGTDAVDPGVWNILPVFNQDHYGFIGGIYSEKVQDVRQIYYDMHLRMHALR